MRRVLPVLTLAMVLALPLSAAKGEDEIPPIPLQHNLRLVLQPTLLGLVPPADAEGYGDVFVRLIGLDENGLTVHYEIKEQAENPAGQGDLTRIRRGEIQVGGLADGLGATPPLFWPDGDWSTEDGLLWLPRASYRELVATGSCPWQLNCRDGGVNAEAEDLSRYLADRGATAGQSETRQSKLKLTGDANYPCLVNGQRAELPARRAVDSLGVAEYWILADADNPLLLKMTLLPPSTEPELADAGAGGLNLLEAGAGYAVVEIDF
jgi:hypothetical protein